MPKKMHQYTLNLPDDLYEKLKTIADEQGISVADLLRRGIKWEMLAHSVDEKGGGIYVKDGPEGELTQIVPL